MPKITFIDPEGTRTEVEVRPRQDDLLEIAEEHGVKMGSACGGVCACSSCHVYVRQGLSSLPEMTDKEEDRLDMGFDVRPYSRLGCQCVVGEQDLVVEITHESLQVWFNEHPDQRR
ncbi:MAG: 2Fe-2S iron-sulfur cluster binding domain-containing protein [Nannocystaceae bacterium]|nr:2Fe-2S iron-sulfur cluster binding domain-containing protein [Nannocystaceae bacterium]